MKRHRVDLAQTEADATGHEVAAERAAPEWRARAACRDLGPEVFFPVGSTGRALDQVEAAKAVCAGCPVKTQCLAWALETNQRDGVWGGTSEDERRALRRNWRWTG